MRSAFRSSLSISAFFVSALVFAQTVPGGRPGGRPSIQEEESSNGGTTSVSSASRPSLVVMLAVDQMRYDYLERFQTHFVPGGFKLFMEQGANFTDCHYRHSVTKTAPGHALMLSGVHAD